MNTETQLTEIQIGDDTFYRISNVDGMRPFFMSIVSDSNHWMFIGSNGGLSAGRKDAEHALFPYYTDDKIIDSVENTGSKSIFQVAKAGEKHVWEPFSIRNSSLYRISRNLYKNVYGNKILFEEVNHDLELAFQYQWNSSDTYGFVRKCKLENLSGHDQSVRVLDGLQNIMPSGVGSALQNQSSNLVDAYKRNELVKDSGVGIFGLSAIIVDKAEPSEALKANMVWSLGWDKAQHLLSSLQLDKFREHRPITSEEDVKGEKGAYFIIDEITLAPKGTKSWMIVADVNKSISSITAISEQICTGIDLQAAVNDDVETGTQKLVDLNAAADGLQLSNDPFRDTRHFSNTLFNIMRGGIFDNNFTIDKNDFKKYLENANRQVANSLKKTIDELPEVFHASRLREVASTIGDASFKRLSTEYLPLKFSRRHGDPSRPWNKFSINTHDERDGSKILDYEGNWRDIFQNWEALALSYPEFLGGMIFRFLNASTFDGYNPYRITKNSIDWERIEPDDPWSYIGYWGDHQIIYLLKFLELSESYYPGILESYFEEDLFVYANVPYKIKSYSEILKNPKDTIDFDHKLDNEISEMRSELGADSALLRTKQGDIVHVNFIEKILATLLSKMSNFIPEGGIWMNTQRPEWNDANNALVGNGVSAVTLYYIHRFLAFTNQLLNTSKAEHVVISEELVVFMNSIRDVLISNKSALTGNITDKLRRKILDGLAIAGSNYRQEVYENSFSGSKKQVAISQLIQFTHLCQEYTEHTIRANKRSDNLYHAYNLMSVVGDNEISISYLSEMLEGQVAVLSSKYLSASEALKVLDALKASSLYRADQNSYILYPNKDLPGFMEKNNVSEDAVHSSPLLRKLIQDGNNDIVTADVKGIFHFNGKFRNARDLRKALDQLEKTEYAELVEASAEHVLQIFEEVFNHKAFTGRSGTFFGYEGLGSIYWHMVSKLALAVQECCLKAIHDEESREVVDALLMHYYEINEGLGLHKSPTRYGAFPTDPYSHTPAGKGAQQPGMTGQVKEDILCRFGELGVVVTGGQLGFDPRLLRKEEFLVEAQEFSYVDVRSQRKKLEAETGTLCFTYCQVPVIYKRGEEIKLEVQLQDGTRHFYDELILDADLSKEVFERTGHVNRIIATIKESMKD